MTQAIRNLATVMTEIIFNDNVWTTLYDSYLPDEEMERRKQSMGVPYKKTKTIVIREWIAHLEKLKENEENRVFCMEVERLLKKTSIFNILEFLVYYPHVENVASYRRNRILTLKQFFKSFYKLETEEDVKKFVSELRDRTLERMAQYQHTKNNHVNKLKFAGLPVIDVDGFKSFFFSSSVEELNKPIPVYYFKEFFGSIEEFAKLPKEELEKYRLGTSYGFSLDYYLSEEHIIAKFKPSKDYPSTKLLKEHYDGECGANYYQIMKNKELAKLIPVFETIKSKPVLKMLVL